MISPETVTLFCGSEALLSAPPGAAKATEGIAAKRQHIIIHIINFLT